MICWKKSDRVILVALFLDRKVFLFYFPTRPLVRLHILNFIIKGRKFC